MTSIFNSIFTPATETIPLKSFLLCLGVSLLIGIYLAWVYSIKNKSSKSFLLSVALMPATVCIVIMMVNGNIGTGVAVAGAFSLIRFRSAQGSAREISTIFIGMGAGLIAGMGFLAYAVLFTLILALIMHFLSCFLLGGKNDNLKKDLRIAIPEDLNYAEVFDEVFKKYTSAYELESVRTSNMGSLFKLRYNITLKSEKDSKTLIDELRTRNGNLEISLSKVEEHNYEL